MPRLAKVPDNLLDDFMKMMENDKQGFTLLEDEFQNVNQELVELENVDAQNDILELYTAFYESHPLGDREGTRMLRQSVHNKIKRVVKKMTIDTAEKKMNVEFRNGGAVDVAIVFP